MLVLYLYLNVDLVQRMNGVASIRFVGGKVEYFTNETVNTMHYKVRPYNIYSVNVKSWQFLYFYMYFLGSVASY